jgi:hypothetical protein
MNMTALRALLEHPRTAMPTKSEELRKLDTALSHGDLGITVGSGAIAMRAAVAELPDDVDGQAVLNANNEAARDAMIETAKGQVETTASPQTAKGRAAWMQERSVGHPDPGATAHLRFQQELRANWWEEGVHAQES